MLHSSEAPCLLQGLPGGMVNHAHNISHLNTAPCLMQVLPPLVGVCPEARLNMAIYHLRRGEAEQAFKVVKDLDPVAPPEYILKGESRHLEGAVCLRQMAPWVGCASPGYCSQSKLQPQSWKGMHLWELRDAMFTGNSGAAKNG